MALDNETLESFSKIVNVSDKSKKDNVLYGTITIDDNKDLCVKIDGSDELTPVVTTIELKEGQRVIVQIINHTAIINGSTSDVSSSSSTVKAIAADSETARKTAEKASSDLATLKTAQGVLDLLSNNSDGAFGDNDGKLYIKAQYVQAEGMDADKVSANSITSKNYEYTGGNFTDSGMTIQLEDGKIQTPFFFSSEDGAVFKGSIAADTLSIGSYHTEDNKYRENTIVSSNDDYGYIRLKSSYGAGAVKPRSSTITLGGTSGVDITSAYDIVLSGEYGIELKSTNGYIDCQSDLSIGKTDSPCDLDVLGATEIAGNLTVGNDDTTSGISATGDVEVGGKLDVTGNVKIGSSDEPSTFTLNGKTYTFPSSAGTLALASELSKYLPLSGGTVTGAISATGQIVSGWRLVSKRSDESSNPYFRFESTDGTKGIHLYVNAAELNALSAGDYSIKVPAKNGTMALVNDWYLADGTYFLSNYRTAGYVSTSKTQIYFTVPLNRPYSGSVTIKPANCKMILRQGGNYTHGSSSGTAVTPSSVSCTNVSGVGFQVTCTMSSTTNAINNDVIGIDVDLTYTIA